MRALDLAVLAVVMPTLAQPAWAQDGSASAPPVSGNSEARTAPVPPAPPIAPAVPAHEAIKLDEYLGRLDDWRNEGRITAAEAARARRTLQAAIVSGDRSAHVPLDASGRIDLLTLARGKSEFGGTSGKSSERLLSRVVNEFDLRMRVKARDMASPSNLALFDGAPGYMAVPTRDLGRIVTGTIERTPIGELPGGTRLAGAIDTLPNTSRAKPDQTIRELSHVFGDRQRDWLGRSSLGGFLGRHKIEAGLLAFGAITSLRKSNPETARAMDRMGIRLRISRMSTPDARLYTTSRLIYRNGFIFPELEMEGGARHGAGSMTLRVTMSGTLGAEAVHHTRGRTGVGARWERGRWFADTNAILAFPEHLARTEVRGGYLTEAGFALSTAVAATFGHGSGAAGSAGGRLSYELDFTKAVLTHRSTGELGVFVSTSADSDFSHKDWRAGMVFRLGL